MCTTAIAYAVTVLAWPGLVLAGPTPGEQPKESDSQPNPAHVSPGGARGEYTGPSVVVHNDGAPATTRDARVKMGDFKISAPFTSARPTAARSDGMIGVPANTIGSGAPLWVIRGLQDADVRIARAEADWVERSARHASGHRWWRGGFARAGDLCCAGLHSWPLVALPGFEMGQYRESPEARSGAAAGPAHAATPAADRAAPAGEGHVAPSVTVRADGAPASAHDRRMQVGDIKISTPRTGGRASAPRSDGLIGVPSNTIDPGLPLWAVRGLQDAEVRIANAKAGWIEARAHRGAFRNDSP